MDKVIIKDLEILAKHGVNPEEKINPQRFIISCEIETSFSKAQISDDLNQTISYSAVKKDVIKIVEGNTFDLIEKLAYEIARAILEKYDLANAVAVLVKKPDAPMSGKFKYVAVEKNLKWHRVYLSLGSSMGNKEEYLDNAIKALNVGCFKNVKESSRIETSPYGGVAKNMFLNSCVECYTYLEPYELLDFIHGIEKDNSRVRDIHWDDRTLDIDILLYDDLVIKNDDLCIPHKDMLNRDFVMIPLKELNKNLF